MKIKRHGRFRFGHTLSFSFRGWGYGVGVTNDRFRESWTGKMVWRTKGVIAYTRWKEVVMKKYVVTVMEVWHQPILVSASSSLNAINRVRDGMGETLEDQLEYSYTLESDTWIVNDAPRGVV